MRGNGKVGKEGEEGKGRVVVPHLKQKSGCATDHANQYLYLAGSLISVCLCLQQILMPM